MVWLIGWTEEPQGAGCALLFTPVAAGTRGAVELRLLLPRGGWGFCSHPPGLRAKAGLFAKKIHVVADGPSKARGRSVRSRGLDGDSSQEG